MGGRALKELVIISLAAIPPAPTKIPNSEDQHMPFHPWAGKVNVVQFIPSELHIPILLLLERAAKIPNSGDQHILYHCWLLTV